MEQIEAPPRGISLRLSVDSPKEQLHVMNLAQQRYLGGQAAGILEQSVSRPQVLGNHAVVIEAKRHTRPREAVELAPLGGLANARLCYLFNQPHQR